MFMCLHKFAVEGPNLSKYDFNILRVYREQKLSYIVSVCFFNTKCK